MTNRFFTIKGTTKEAQLIRAKYERFRVKMVELRQKPPSLNRYLLGLIIDQLEGDQGELIEVANSG